MRVFILYAAVGMMNTLIHWTAFYCFHIHLEFGQALSNLFAFAIAVTFSFIVNARVTFSSGISLTRYVLFTGFMGLMALGFGYLADLLQLPALLTLIAFSATSLVLGFLYSKYIVFRGEE